MDADLPKWPPRSRRRFSHGSSRSDRRSPFETAKNDFFRSSYGAHHSSGRGRRFPFFPSFACAPYDGFKLFISGFHRSGSVGVPSMTLYFKGTRCRTIYLRRHMVRQRKDPCMITGLFKHHSPQRPYGDLFSSSLSAMYLSTSLTMTFCSISSTLDWPTIRQLVSIVSPWYSS